MTNLLNEYIINPEKESESFLRIVDKNGIEFKSIIDSNIVPYLRDRTWYAKKRDNKHNPNPNYDVYSIQGNTKALYVFVMKFNNVEKPQDEQTYSVDHINRDTLDNRLNNLRWSTKSEQAMNTNKRPRKYNAQPLPDGILQEHLPKFVTYNKEVYNKTNGKTREFFRICAHPYLKDWTSSKSTKVTIQEKLAETYKYLRKNGYDPLKHPVMNFYYSGCIEPDYVKI